MNENERETQFLHISAILQHSIYSPWQSNVSIENCHLNWIFPLNILIFHSYVKLPEGIGYHDISISVTSPLRHGSPKSSSPSSPTSPSSCVPRPSAPEPPEPCPSDATSRPASPGERLQPVEAWEAEDLGGSLRALQWFLGMGGAGISTDFALTRRQGGMLIWTCDVW